MGAPRLRPEHIALIGELGDSGKSDAYIAAQLRKRFGFAISTSAISWHRLKIGAEPASRTRVDEPPIEPVAYGRAGHVVRRFTQAEDAQLLAMEKQRASVNAMAKALGRRSNSVIGRLMTLARHEARRERAMERTP